MDRSRVRTATLACAAAALFSIAFAAPAAAAYPRGVLQHIVFVIQENRSVDNLFNGFPGADTVRVGRRHNGSPIKLRPISLSEPTDVDHARDSFLNEYDNGKMDGFDLVGTLPDRKNGDFPYSYVQQSDVRPYWTLAQRYSFGDRTFESLGGPSFAAHQYLLAGQSDDAVSNPDKLGADLFWWGCDSPKGTLVTLLGAGGKADGPKVFPCFKYRSLADLLDEKGRDWRDYGPRVGDIASIWTGFDAIRSIRYSRDWATKVVSPETRFLSDVAGGTLADVTWVTPDFRSSDHATFGIKQHPLAHAQSDLGPQWVANVVDSIGRSRFWNSTAIVIVWDDWGGWYDHVTPPHLDAMGLGMRVPMIVVSPYAKHGYVSHAQHEFGSFLKFAEEVFDLPSLGATDVRADDLSDCFDFKQTPQPLVQIPVALSAADFEALRPSGVAPDDD